MDGAPQQAHVIVAGRLVLADRVAPGRLHIEGDRIAAIELGHAQDTAMPYIAPGFVDLHVHGWGGHDAMSGPPALEAMARALLGRGVTSFLPTAITAPLDRLLSFATTVRDWLPAAPLDGAAPLGFNLEGPFLSPHRSGLHDPAFLLEPARVDRGELEPLVPGLRVMTVAPELPGATELIRWLSGRGVQVSLGHSAADLAGARAGFAAGARSATHLFNAMTGLDHAAPGLAAAALVDDAVYVELIADGHHVDRALWRVVARTKPEHRLLLVSDAIAAAGTGASRSSVGRVEIEIDGDRSVAPGSGRPAGSVIALDTAVRNLVAAGIGLPAAIAGASTNPMAMLGIDDAGRLAEDQVADLVELDRDLAVRRVMRRGAWVVGTR